MQAGLVRLDLEQRPQMAFGGGQQAGPAILEGREQARIA